MKKLNYYQKIEQAKQKKAEQLKDIAEKLAEALENQRAAEKAATAALNSGNAEVYAKAKAAERDAEAMAEFYRLRKEKAEKEPLFDGAQLESVMEEINNDLKASEDSAAKEAALAIDNTVSLLEDLLAKYKRIDAARKDIGREDSHTLGRDIELNGLINTLKRARDNRFMSSLL